MIKKKSFFYRDWKYKIRWNERATPIMTGHMHLILLTNTHKLKIRKASVYGLKSRFKFKKSINW